MLLNRDKKIMRTLERVAMANEPAARARVGAMLAIKHEIVSVGYNKIKSDPFQKSYAKNSMAIYMHAEISAIKAGIKQYGVDELKRATLYICRVKGLDLDWGMACPCEGCKRAIIEFGIKKVVYSGNKREEYGVWERGEKFREMTPVSKGATIEFE